MKTIKTWLTTIAVLLCSITASAHNFEVDGIYYNITSSTDLTVEVTYRGDSYDSYRNRYSGDVIVPSTVTYDGRTYRVSYIGDNAFRNCNGLTSITLPEGLISIGDYAFYSCNDLTSITFPERLISIGDYAFYSCKDLTSITLPEGLISIGDYTFYSCDGLTSITLPASLYSIGVGAFLDCERLTSVTFPIPEFGMRIRSGAFSSCDRLTAVHISSLKAWCEISFDYSDSNPLSNAGNLYLNGELVTDLVLPNSLTEIGSYAFYGCAGLTSITLPEGVTGIGRGAFAECSSLTSITIPEGVTSIGREAFWDCSSLTSITLPESVVSIGREAFEGCIAVESLTVKGGVMPTVPSSALTSITMFSPAPLETEEFASKVYRNATVYVPVGSLSRYQNADVWKKFWNIVEFDPTGIEGITVDDTQAPVYNIKGVRVSGSPENLPAGIYIRNGKKLVVM